MFAPVEPQPSDVAHDLVDILLRLLRPGSCRRSGDCSARRTPARRRNRCRSPWRGRCAGVRSAPAGNRVTIPAAVLPRQPVLFDDVANEVTGRRLRAAFGAGAGHEPSILAYGRMAGQCAPKRQAGPKPAPPGRSPCPVQEVVSRGRGGRHAAARGDGARRPPAGQRRPVGADGAASRLQRWRIRVLHQLQQPQSGRADREPARVVRLSLAA